MRIKFDKGQQRVFLNLVLKRSNCPSLRSLISRGFDVPYSTLKSYYGENRTIPEIFFNELCIFADLKKEDFKFKFLNENWGQVLGGKN
jgi:hypothetical protein